ncbi:hypothetical protein [Candidatus Roseilinea sp. NK_OTU-006]|jgi:hypothetical protein|nr:hypothetical protein [Candidatus Roseilinea sp. NK_OTU-006]
MGSRPPLPSAEIAEWEVDAAVAELEPRARAMERRVRVTDDKADILAA